MRFRQRWREKLIEFALLACGLFDPARKIPAETWKHLETAVTLAPGTAVTGVDVATGIEQGNERIE